MADRDGVDEESKARELRSRLLPPARWMQLLECVVEFLPRSIAVVTPRPERHLRRLGAADRWATTDRMALFVLDVPEVFLRPGWRYIEAAVHYSSSNRVAAVFFDTGEGFRESECLRLVGNRRGSIREVFRVPANTRRMAWTPTLETGVFRQSEIALHAITPLEAQLRMLERLWTHRRERTDVQTSTVEQRYAAIRSARLARGKVDYHALALASSRSARVQSATRDAARGPFFCVRIDERLASGSPFARESLARQSYRSFRIDAGVTVAPPAFAGPCWLLSIRDSDQLTEDAIDVLAHAIESAPDAVIVYSDHDFHADDGTLTAPSFKPDWNFELFLTHNYLAQLCAVKIFSELQMRMAFDELLYERGLTLGPGALASGSIIHIPQVLCHRNPAANQLHGGEQAPDSLRSIAARTGFPAHFLRRGDGTFDPRFPFDEPAHLVSIIIPTRNQHGYVARCIESIRRLTAGVRYEILVIDNQSDEPATLALLDALRGQRDIRVEQFDQPFNYSSINNFAASIASGDLLAFVNNDVEVIAPDWLIRMSAMALRADVGAVGARLLYSDDHVQHAGVVLGIGGIAGHVHRFLPRAEPGYGGRAVLVQQLSAVTAACMVVQKAKFLAVEGFDPQRFAVAFNDVDLCLRLAEQGFRSIYEPNALLYHHESISRGPDDTPEKQKIFLQEAAAMRARWGTSLANDPFYNPNLSLDNEGFEINRVLVTSVPASRYRAARRQRVG